MAKGPLLNSPSLSYLEVITSVNYILKASCLETRVLDFTNVSETMPQRPRVSYHEKVFKKTVKDIKKRSCNSLHPVLSHGYSWNVFLLTDFLTSLNSQLAVVYIKESVPIWETLHQNLPYFDILKMSKKVIAMSWVCFCLAPKSDRQLDSKNAKEARSTPSRGHLFWFEALELVPLLTSHGHFKHRYMSLGVCSYTSSHCTFQ